MRTEVELSLHPKQSVIIDTNIYAGTDKMVETNTIVDIDDDDGECKEVDEDDECKEVDEDVDDDECKDVDENINISSSNKMGDYVVGVNILDMPYVVNDNNHHFTIQNRNDYDHPMHPLFYAILGFIIIVVVTFVSV